MEYINSFYYERLLSSQNKQVVKIVKYSVLKESQQLFASKYKLYLPTEEELIHELESELLQLKLETRQS